MKILLMGNPNVGKSVLFSRLTGVRVIASNYPGTTIGFTKGYLKLGEEPAEIIDVPGTYTLEPTSKAEEVAAEMLKEGDIVINVVDATNLERNLYLTLQLLEHNIPLIIALNLWDDTQHKGINIDLARLEELLGVPVIPTVAITGQGIKTLVNHIPKAVSPRVAPFTRDQRWTTIGDIISKVQTITHRHHTWREKLEDATIRPLSGIFIAASVLYLAFQVIRLIGESFITYIADPLFQYIWSPLMLSLSQFLGSTGFLHDIFIGQLIGGDIDYWQSFGMLTTGLYIPFAAVLPYILAFYFVLGLLEDVGYLPRLAVLMDTIMHRMGLHGFAIIPTILGLGCNVPAILATRILESKRERFIAATLISIGIPCAALQAMVLGLVGQHGGQYVAIVYGTLFVVWVCLGLILNLTVKGFSPELLVEIPPYRLPPWSVIGQKLWLRVYGFLKEALPVVLIGVFAVNILYSLGIFDYIANIAAPVVSGLFGLPREAVTALVIGFLRKDVAVGMLAPLGLTAQQLVVGCVVLAMSFPCIATFAVLIRELGLKDMLRSTAIMLVSTLIVGSLLNLIL